VLNKDYKAPIKPKVKSEGDYKNVDKQFLKEEIRNTPCKEIDLQILNKMHFDNFTYNGDAIVAGEYSNNSMDKAYEEVVCENSIYIAHEENNDK
jgi:hypothetical protein